MEWNANLAFTNIGEKINVLIKKNKMKNRDLWKYSDTYDENTNKGGKNKKRKRGKERDGERFERNFSDSKKKNKPHRGNKDKF